MGDDVVTIVIKRKTAEELVNAYIIALGSYGSYKKGKGKKKNGGGKKPVYDNKKYDNK